MTILWCVLAAAMLTALQLYMVGRAWQNGVQIGCMAGIIMTEEKIDGKEAFSRAIETARKMRGK